MAKKQRVRIKNSRPRHNWDTDVISVDVPAGSSSASGSTDENGDSSYSGGCSAESVNAASTETIPDVVKHSIHEVGQNGSSFPGTDSYGRDMEGATFADREKLFHRYDLIEGLTENGLVDEEGFPISDSDVTIRQYVYDNPTLERRNGSDKKITLLRKEEDSTVLLPAHDEEYFQHVMSWPTSHTLRQRKIAGFLLLTTTKSSSQSTPESEPGAGDGTSCTKSSTNYTMLKQQQYYDVNFTLDDVETKIYQPNPEAGSIKGDKVWNYNELTFDATTGVLQNKNADIRDKLGDPIVYSGDRHSNGIFFNYIPDNTSYSTVVTHVFDDDNNDNISFSTTGNITVDAKNLDDPGGSNDSKNRKHYDITFPKPIVSLSNVRIHFNQKKTASGVTSSRLFVSKIKQLKKKKIRVWFETESGDNTFARNWTVSIGGGEAGAMDVIGIGDTVNGATVTNVVNYIEEVALLRTVNRQPRKGVEDANITESNFLALTNADGSSQGLTSIDYARTRAWIKINDTRDIIKGMNVQGKGIKLKTTNVTAVDYANNKVYLSDTVKSKKLKNVKFIDDSCNRVSKHTLCYATLSGGSNFAIDTNYTVTRSGENVCTIKVKAGKGILNRSAVVGTWFSDVKHEIEYQPIFYGSDAECEKEIDSDDFGEYTLGTIMWNDGTRLEDVYLLTDPADNFGYTASQVHFALTYAPIDQATLQKIDREVAAELSSANPNSTIGRMNAADPILTTRYIIFNKVSEHCKNTLGGRKSVKVFDSICRDDIQPIYFNMYDPINEQYSLGTNLSAVQQNIVDYCGVTNPELNPAIQGAEIAAQNSTVLPEEYYKQFAGNPDSLLNRLKSGFDTVEAARPKNKIKNLPPQIVGEDQSGRVFMKTSFRDLPPKTDRVGYFCNDLIVTDDKFLNPILDLDPQTTINQPRIIVRSRPKWTASNSGQTWPISVSTEAGVLTTSMSVTVNNDSNGHVGNITTSAAPGDSATVTNTIADGTETITCTIEWVPLSDVKAKENAQFFTRDAFPDVYTIGTNVSRPPGGNHDDSYAKTDLRDLLYKERPRDPSNNDEYLNDMLTAPSHVIYPATVWEPNVNYQQDFYKMLEFRLQEHSELIGETIENKGNPYVDQAITTKLRENLNIGDTSITVDSTGEFLSSGYLIIPKYIQKIMTLETGNNNSLYYYSGEEIIYYGSKTETTFDNIQRGMFGTNSGFEETVSVESVEEGVIYKIATLGSSNWKKIGAGKNPSVGDIFTATKHNGSGTGTVVVYGTTSDAIPDEELITGLSSPTPKVPVITSYEKGFSIAQHAVFSLKY